MTDYSNLDKFGTPLIICSRDWKIIYKNRNAKKYLRNPRCGVTLDRFFDKTDIEYDNVQRIMSENDKDSLFILPIVFEGNLMRALSFIYNDDIAVLFPAFIRYESVYTDLRAFMSAGKSDAFRRVLDAYTSLKSDKSNNFFRVQAARDAMYNLFELVFVNSHAAEDDAEDNDLYPVRDAFIILKEKLSVYLSVLSYRLFIDISDLSEYSDGCADMKRFIPVFFNIMLFSVSVSCNKACNTVIRENDGVFVCEFTFQKNKAKPHSIRGSSLYDFMESAPAEYLNVLPYELLSNKIGYDISYRVDEDAVTISLKLRSKPKRDGFFRSPTVGMFGVESIDSFTEKLIKYLFCK